MLETEVVQLLREKGLTIALAESCTGGRVCDLLTGVPGCSDILKGGVVAYSNGSKVRLLGVSEETLQRHGAVSAECAMEMAKGARKAFGSDISVSITGIAGPGGGSPVKPVGLVYFGLAREGQTDSFRRMFEGDRKAIKEQAAEFALKMTIDSFI